MDPVLDILNERPKLEWQWAFEPDAAGRSAVNALALCNLALLAYSDEADMHLYLERWKLKLRSVLRFQKAQGLIATDDKCVFIAFRGTEPTNAIDWISDINYHLTPIGGNIPGRVHGGFQEIIGHLRQDLFDAVAKVRDERERVFVTGHSLGGALAVLAGALLKADGKCPVTAIYTYGQPRVGDLEFCTAFNQELRNTTFRYVNNLDIVPHLPPKVLPALTPVTPPASTETLLQKATHVFQQLKNVVKKFFAGEKFDEVGELILFLSDGHISRDPQDWNNREVTYSGNYADLFDHGPDLLRFKFGQLLHEQDRILDHDPLRGYLAKFENQAK